MKTGKKDQKVRTTRLTTVALSALVAMLLPGQSYAESDPCEEQGPHWGSWSGDCPSLISEGSVEPTLVNQCGITAPIMPTNIIAPVYSTNTWQRTGTYNCSSQVATNTEKVTYSAGGVIWTNFSSPYTSFPSLVTNNFSADAYVSLTSSSTNCPSPGLTKLGKVSWNLPCPTITNLTVIKCGILTRVVIDGGLWPVYGMAVNYDFQCANGWYSWENNSFTQNCDDDPTTSQQTAATSTPWYTGDGIGNTMTNLAVMSCSMVSTQTVYFATVGGGSTSNNNSVCSFNNIRTLTITKTNSSAPWHGIISLTITGIAGGLSAQCSF